MKSKIIAFTVAAVVWGTFSLPSHAINANYRNQLIKSGCTQVTEANGTCDIHKTKAQNEARFSTDSKIKERREVAAFIEDSILGANTWDANAAFESYGFTPVDAGIWKKGKIRVATQAANGKIVAAVIKK